MRALVREALGVVSLHRAEGFGLVLADAMSIGVPVVATGYSGNLDFMTEDNSLLVDYTLVRSARAMVPIPRMPDGPNLAWTRRRAHPPAGRGPVVPRLLGATAQSPPSTRRIRWIAPPGWWRSDWKVRSVRSAVTRRPFPASGYAGTVEDTVMIDLLVSRPGRGSPAAPSSSPEQVACWGPRWCARWAGRGRRAPHAVAGRARPAGRRGGRRVLPEAPARGRLPPGGVRQGSRREPRRRCARVRVQRGDQRQRPDGLHAVSTTDCLRGGDSGHVRVPYSRVPLLEEDVFQSEPHEGEYYYAVGSGRCCRTYRCSGAPTARASASVCSPTCTDPVTGSTTTGRTSCPSLVRRFVNAQEQGLNEVVVWGRPDTTRDFLYVDDAVHAMLAMTRAGADVCNLASGPRGHDAGARRGARAATGFAGASTGPPTCRSGSRGGPSMSRVCIPSTRVRPADPGRRPRGHRAWYRKSQTPS